MCTRVVGVIVRRRLLQCHESTALTEVSLTYPFLREQGCKLEPPKASRSEVNAAKARYRKLKAGDPQKLTINQGDVVGACFRSQLAHMRHLRCLGAQLTHE